MDFWIIKKANINLDVDLLLAKETVVCINKEKDSLKQKKHFCAIHAAISREKKQSWNQDETEFEFIFPNVDDDDVDNEYK